MLNLPAELGWVSENLPFNPRLRIRPQGRFSLTHPRSAGRFIPDPHSSGLLLPIFHTRRLFFELWLVAANTLRVTILEYRGSCPGTFGQPTFSECGPTILSCHLSACPPLSPGVLPIHIPRLHSEYWLSLHSYQCSHSHMSRVS